MSLCRIKKCRFKPSDEALNQRIAFELSKTLPFLHKKNGRNRFKSQKKSSLQSMKTLNHAIYDSCTPPKNPDPYNSIFHFGHSKSRKSPLRIRQPQSSDGSDTVTIKPYQSKMALKLKQTSSSIISRSKSSLFPGDSYTNLIKKKTLIKKKKLIKQYLKTHKYSFAREIPLPLLALTKKQSPFDTPNKFMENTCMKHEKEGFMRRNKLLLEYLLHERLKKTK
ncbi:unnamed protein product [Moneuplotes crassus]|uniref:Uncharacterized protein n=1 Tax=Euplotes crassus TaxID=5936 RepID=A0AAD2CZV9_EUPCR|nr:unnamed protein product [Moneuplotes crassus]